MKFHPFDPNIEYLSEKQIKKFMRHCIRGLHYSKLIKSVKDDNELSKNMLIVHINNIVHRDIKPQNILITYKMKAKLGDFGVS